MILQHFSRRVSFSRTFQGLKVILQHFSRRVSFSRTIQGLKVILQHFSWQISFLRTFQESSSYSSTFQACVNPGHVNTYLPVSRPITKICICVSLFSVIAYSDILFLLTPCRFDFYLI